MFVYVFNVRVHKNVYQNQKNNTLKTYTHFYVSIVRSGSEDQLLCNILKLLFMDVRLEYHATLWNRVLLIVCWLFLFGPDLYWPTWAKHNVCVCILRPSFRSNLRNCCRIIRIYLSVQLTVGFYQIWTLHWAFLPWSVFKIFPKGDMV